MSTKTTNILLIALMGATVIAGIVAYPTLPAEIDAHWNAQGVADDTVPKFWGVFLFPIIMAAMFVLSLIIPRMDPLKANLESFRGYYNRFWISLFGFFAYLFTLVLVWNVGYRFNFGALLLPAFAILFWSIGVLMENSKRNWFVGIRTPWTLSSDVVWDKTHRLGGKLFKWAGAVSLLGLLFQDSALLFFFVIVPVVAVSFITMVYSYIVHRHLTKS